MQVNIGIIDANPRSTAKVVTILAKLHEYIPKLSVNNLLTVPVQSDCLSVERMADAKRARSADLTSYDQLEGAEPVLQEFHHAHSLSKYVTLHL